MTDREHELVSFDRSADYWLKHARRRQRGADPVTALVLARQAFQQTHRMDIALDMAALYFEMGCFTAVYRLVAQILAQDADCAPAYYWLGLAALEEGNENLADQALCAALQKGRRLPLADDVQDLMYDYPWTDPPRYRRSQRAYCLYDAAQRALQQGDGEAAAELLRRAVRRGTCPEAECLAAQLALYNGQLRRVVRHADRTLRHQPDNLYAWVMMAQAFQLKRLNASASRAFERALALADTPAEWALVAEIGQRLDQKDATEARLREALHKSPESNDLRYVLAALLANTGRQDEAARLFRIILDRDPDDTDASWALRLMGPSALPCVRFSQPPSFDQYLSPRPGRGDDRLRRLSHGLTISLGDLPYRHVRALSRSMWERLSPLQKRLCDRQPDWPNAFYRTIARASSLDVPSVAPLWPACAAHRVRRMTRYLTRKTNEHTE